MEPIDRLGELSQHQAEMLAEVKQIRKAFLRMAIEKQGPPPLYLDENVCSRFLRWSADTQHNSAKWVGAQRRYLAWWSVELAGVNLRGASLPERILPALGKANGGRQPRIAVLKRFYSYLRQVEFLISPQEDPTLGALSVPQSKPAQWRKEKHFSRETFLLIRSKMPARWADLVTVLAGTGWHLTELQRFAREGTALRERMASNVLLCPKSKAGEPLRTRVSAEVSAAGLRVLKAGGFSEKLLRRAMVRACAAAGTERITPGRFRHAVSTFAINSGAPASRVATFLNHKSPATTRRFYATHATPAKVPTLV